MGKNNEEQVLIVDRENKIIGTAPRSEMRARRLGHRAVYILVFNSGCELFLQQRTLTKDIYPGYYDIAAGGVVGAGESYEEAAVRELAEELGIEGVSMRSHFDLKYEDSDNFVWGRVYSCSHDGPMILQEEEVAGGRFMATSDILALSETTPFTPDGLVVLRRYLEEEDAAVRSEGN